MNPDETENLGRAQSLLNQEKELWCTWKEIVEQCRNKDFKGIDVGSKKRRRAILFVNDQLN